MYPRLKRSIAYWLAISFALMQVTPAYAGMIDTQALVDEASAQFERDHLKSALEREEVRRQLAEHGVTVEQAQERIDALTDQEVSQLAAHFGDRPAGGVIEFIIIAGLVVVILELVGVTDIFTQF